jgi:hypothetical protein
VFELPGRHKDCVEQLLDLMVSYLSTLQDLADKVNELLFDLCRGFRPFNNDNGADNYVGDCNV